MIQTVTMLWKDENSGKSGCPALYEAAGAGGTPGHVVQGKEPTARVHDRAGYLVYGKALTAVELAVLSDVAADEGAVWVPAGALGAASTDDREPVRGLAAGEAVVWVPANVLDRLQVA